MKGTAIITGASGGIGRAVSVLLAEKGMNVVLGYNSSQEEALNLEKELKDRGAEAVAVKCDVRFKKDTDRLAETAKERFGRIDVLVNNAGVAQQKLFTDITEEDYDKIFDVNVKGTFNCCQSVLKDMIYRKSGSIINISSMWGTTGASCEVHYSASKAAVIGMTKALAKEVGLSGIRVNCIAPGLIDTKMNSALSQSDIEQICEQTPLSRIGKPEDIASAVYFLACESSSFVTGQILGVDGGFAV